MHLGNTKGRYARICIKLPIEILIRKQIQIGNLKQGIFYKGTDSILPVVELDIDNLTAPTGKI